ncbi:MAG TPA: hypothetical protein VN026_19050 [Bacteroidia bacterium]|jgi:hypothetical protein|nr:hypothetical protein [Bacteroidia bacterium]
MKNILSCILIILFISCKKNNTGGECNITAFPQHHGKPIKGATVYVKFGAQDLPADPTNNYNLKITALPDEDHANIKSLRYGKYYLYSVGFDSSIMLPVMGGISLNIKWAERKKAIDLNIPVTE